MKFDLPPGWEKLFGMQDKPKKPEKGMTTEELIRNMEHNIKCSKQDSKL